MILTLLFVGFAGKRSLEVEAWYKESFPSNLIVVQNQGDPLSDVEVVVDRKYRARIPRLEKGATGLQIEREFRDELDFPPPATYKPSALEIRAAGSRRELELHPEKR